MLPNPDEYRGLWGDKAARDALADYLPDEDEEEHPR